MDKTMQETAKLFEKYGWEMLCYSPLYITHEDGWYAGGSAALLILADIREQERDKTIELTVDEIKTLISDAGSFLIGYLTKNQKSQTGGWSDSSYKIIEFIGGNPHEEF